MIGFEPTGPEQAAIIRCRKRFKAVAGGGQAGKHLHVDTPIPTPTGWKRMGDLMVGDVIFDGEGQQVVIEWVGEEQDQPCYRLAFDNGSEIIASASHQWEARNESARRHGFGAKVWTTAEMVDGGVSRVFHRERTRPSIVANWSIAAPGPLQCPEIELPLDPYALGVWLGDGNGNEAAVTTAEQDVLVNLAWAGIDVRPSD